MQLRGAWDRNNPRLLGQQPRERDLSWCRLLPFCDLVKQIDYGLIRFPSLRRKARQRAAEIGAVEFRVFVDLARQEALPKRAIRHETNPEFLECGYHFLLRLPPPQRVFALDRSDRLDGVCTTDRLCGCFRHAEVLDLALLNEVLHGSRDVFDRNLGVHTVLIVEIDGINPEPLQRPFDGLLDVLGPAIHACRSRPMIGATKIEPEFGGDHYLPAEGSEGFADEFFVQERAVDFCGVKECDAAFNGSTEKRGHLLLVFGRAVGKTHSHAAEPQSRNFEIAFSKFALLHCFSFKVLSRMMNQPFWPASKSRRCRSSGRRR